MSGRVTGSQARVREVEPRAIFIHFSAHHLNLSVQDSLEEITIVRNTIGLTKDTIIFTRDSTKRLHDFKDIKSDDSSDLITFCPTR